MSKVPEQFQIPKDPKKLLAWAEKHVEDSVTLDEFQAKQNLAFLMGRQWGVWDTGRRRFHSDRNRRGDPNAPVRVTVNKIAGLVERSIAKLTKAAPIPEARPVSDTAADQNAAKVATRILDHELTTNLKLQQRLVELYFWVFPLGWSFLHPRWDPNSGPVVGRIDENGKEVSIRQGDIVMDEVPGFEIGLDPNARRWRDAMWCRRSVAMTKEAVFEQYGKEVEADDSDSLADEWMALGSEYTDAIGRSGRTGKTSKGMVTVNQLWIRPGGRITPEGCVITWSGKTILEGPMPFPYAHGRLPFVPFNLLPALGGSPVGRTWVTDLIPMQRDYNDARSREAMTRRSMAPKLLAPIASIDPNRVTSRVEVIPYNASVGGKPDWLLPDARWMTQHETAMNRADAEMGDRAGMQEVSQGKAASSAPAASILALQEADDTKLAIAAGELAAGVEELGYQVIMLVKQFWDEERTIRTWSRDGNLEVAQFTGADIADELDIHVGTESSLPKSKSARTQLAIDLRSAGILQDDRQFVRMLDLPGTDTALETLNLDSKQAEREHGHLLKMEPVEAKVWHNHAIHITEHNEFRKSEEYEQLSPEQQAWFDGHVAAHYQQVLTQMTSPAPGTSELPGGAGPTGNPTGENGEYTNPLTGSPQDPLAVAAGLAPSSLQGSQVQANTGVIGGVGNPGPVPGQTADSQNARMGN